MSAPCKYDFIFLGAGLASLSIVMRMIKSGKFSGKKILLIDKEPKTKNDRTWCYWDTGAGFFEDIVCKKWDTISFYSDSFSSHINIEPYQYKMIRGIDLYQYCFGEIEQQNNIDIIYGEASTVPASKDDFTIQVDGKIIQAGQATIFNSILPKEPNAHGSVNLLQHFKGWVIETTGPAFDRSKAIFMDFRVSQRDDTTFGYLLPLSATKALVEYTLFSKNLLDDPVYETELKNYIENLLQIKEYQITEKEFGVIPMTNRKFSFYEKGCYHIGAAGGQTKASSGYTFQFIQKQSGQIVDHLIQNRDLRKVPPTPNRFLFYDKVLLDVLYHKRVAGKDIFSIMFKKNKPQSVLKFLDNETTLNEELKIISTLPALPFLKAAINQF